jgi:hypothetical protein
MEDILIFTEAYNCGLILKKSLETFHQYHNKKVTVFGTAEDFKHLTPHKNNILYDISEFSDIIDGYRKGHNGTAHIFAKVINGALSNAKKVIHFDSDTIFRSECIEFIENKLDENNDLVGPYRCYKNNLNGRTDLGHLKDVVQTYIFGFNKEKISGGIEPNLVSMCEGLYNPLGHPILDFFDPISFNILNNGGNVYFLDHHDYGGMDSQGNKDNHYGEVNHKIDFGHKIIHFAGVGSGMSYYNNPSYGSSIGYVNWAKSQYVIYQKLFYDENFPGEYDSLKYQIIKDHLN